MRAFLFSLMFFTRIPVKVSIENYKDAASKAVRYLPLVGIIVGGLSALLFYGCSFIFPVSVSIVISMITSLFITGAFHEDGLADICDGFGGGRTRERKLEIMKDSNIGAFGTIGLIMILGFKFILLNEMNVKMLPFVMIAAHSLSRFTAVTIMRSLEYVRNKDQSKVIHVIKKISYTDMVVAGLFGILPLFLFWNVYYFLLIIPVFIAKWILEVYFKKQVGGYTGDCLGATQQICEIVFYLSFLILWTYIL